MEATNLNFNLVDSYLAFLNTLSAENKLELIAKLSNSLQGGNTYQKKSISDLYGAFTTKKTADEIIGDLKTSRNFIRKTEDL